MRAIYVPGRVLIAALVLVAVVLLVLALPATSGAALTGLHPLPKPPGCPTGC